jgi:hypothetical protein
MKPENADASLADHAAPDAIKELRVLAQLAATMCKSIMWRI